MRRATKVDEGDGPRMMNPARGVRGVRGRRVEDVEIPVSKRDGETCNGRRETNDV